MKKLSPSQSSGDQQSVPATDGDDLTCSPDNAQDQVGNAALLDRMPASCEYEVERGDTLWGIAAQFYGEGSAWGDLYQRNSSIIGDNPDLILPGQILSICDGVPETEEEAAEMMCEMGPTIDMSDGGECVDITEPTTVTSSIGEMQVFPNDFAGPLPEGAVTAETHDRMVAIYEAIRDGNSQLSIDTSNITAGIDQAADPVAYAAAVAEAEQFEGDQLEYLRQLVRTDIGLDLLEAMDASEHTTTIVRGDGGSNSTGYASGADRGNGTGTDITITMNPNLSSYVRPGEEEEAWMTERQQYGLYHEMVHAYHGLNGQRASGRSPGTDVRNGSERDLNNAEWQAMGMGDHDHQRFTDNAIREALGKETRPHYSHLTPSPASP